MLSSFMEELIKDKLLTDTKLQTEKAAADQVWQFHQRCKACLEQTDTSKDYPGKDLPFRWFLFRPYHEMIRGWSQDFSVGKCLMTKDWLPLWVNRYSRKNVQVEENIPFQVAPLLTLHEEALQQSRNNKATSSTSTRPCNPQQE